MSYQLKFVLTYLGVAFFLIVFHHGLKAQSVVPDTKIKTNISTLNNSLEYLNQLQPKRFEYNTMAMSQLKLPTGKYYGFLAEEFREVFPFMVSNRPYVFSVGKNAQQTALVQEINTEGLIPLLVGAIQEQQAMIEELRKEVKSLKAQQQTQ